MLLGTCDLSFGMLRIPFLVNFHQEGECSGFITPVAMYITIWQLAKKHILCDFFSQNLKAIIPGKQRLPLISISFTLKTPPVALKNGTNSHVFQVFCHVCPSPKSIDRSWNLQQGEAPHWAKASNSSSFGTWRISIARCRECRSGLVAAMEDHPRYPKWLGFPPIFFAMEFGHLDRVPQP